MKTQIIARIAARSIAQNPRRSILFGAAIFLSAFLFLLSAAVFEGSGELIARDTREILTGDVGVFWKSIEDYSRDDPSRLFNSRRDADTTEDTEARAAKLVADYASAHPGEIASVRRHSLRSIVIGNGTNDKGAMLYSVAPADIDTLIKEDELEGASPGGLGLGRGAILVSQDCALALGLSPGSSITVQARTLQGAQNAMDLRVCGVFRNKAPWINAVVFCTDEVGRELFDEDAGAFDVAKLFLRRGTNPEAVASAISAEAKGQSLPLVAESIGVAGGFFSGISKSSKAASDFTAVLLFLVIGLGIHSTTRALLFQRIREIGTLRAIGYSTADCAWISVTESVFLALAALALAAVAAGATVLALNLFPIRLPAGPLLYMFGSDSFHPILKLSDLGLCAGLVGLMALLAPLGPALRIACLDPASSLAGMLERPSRRESARSVT